MNRRGFISLLAGAAGAPLVPWRGIITPLIVLPPAWRLVEISGLQIRELAAPMEWLSGYQVNNDSSYIRSDRLELLEACHRRMVEFVDARTRRSILVRL